MRTISNLLERSRRHAIYIAKTCARATLRFAYVTWRALGGQPRSDLETRIRLAFAFRGRRDIPGRFAFPFGTIRYLDGPSLRSQFREIFQERSYDFLTKETSPAIIDCGGNIGMSVIRFKQLYPRARITVFEADPNIADVLSANVATLGLKDIEVVPAAAWIRSEQVGFSGHYADSGRISSNSGRTVQAIRLSDTISGPVALLKLDIEGAEHALIADLCVTGKITFVNRIICEIHGHKQDNQALGRTILALAQAGFDISCTFARPAPDLPGVAWSTPYQFLPDGRFLLHLYCWRVEARAPD